MGDCVAQGPGIGVGVRGSRCVLCGVPKLPWPRDGYLLSQSRPPTLSGTQKPRLAADLADRLLIARLEIDSQAMSYVSDRLRLSQC